MNAQQNKAFRQSNFGLSFISLSGEKKEAIRRVYTFCRVLDDVADEPGPISEKIRRLKEWREELGECYRGRPTRPVTKNLFKTITRFEIQKNYFEDLLDGVEMDLTTHEFADFNHLSSYCYRVAGAVGLLCLPIFGCPEDRGRDYALNLGTALQLTNIIRDVREDAVRGRLYIPLDEMKRFGYSKGELLDSIYNSAFEALMNFQTERAVSFYRKARLAMPGEYRRQMLTAEIMESIYFSLLGKIKKHRFQVFQNRFKLSKPRKAGLALKAFFFNRMGLDREMKP